MEEENRINKIKTTLTVEFLGQQYPQEYIIKKALEACSIAGKKPKKSFDVYFKAGVNEVYYVVDGEGSPDYKVII